MQAKKGEEPILGIAVSHPDKELWPKSRFGPAVNKRDLAAYMAAAAARMLPHVGNRPLSVLRAPDGIAGGHFFQRHPLKGTAVPTLAIKVKGEAEPFLGIANASALVALAQQAVVEIHPWGSRQGDPETPERIIFDLDPAPDVGFDHVIDAAKELRARLAKLGFTAFVKTMGGKGLHVVIAVSGKPTWPQAKSFAKSLAQAMERDSPERYTAAPARNARRGKIFIDYLRNDRTATAVAPWSPRLREGATIAVPLTWTQLKKGLDPHQFTLPKAGPLLRRPDPWAELAQSARPLGPALRKLGH